MGHNHAPLVRLQKTHNVAETDGLANARATDDGYGLAGIDMKIAID